MELTVLLLIDVNEILNFNERNFHIYKKTCADLGDVALCFPEKITDNLQLLCPLSACNDVKG